MTDKTTGSNTRTPMKTVTIYTDGACSGNPGPGGWGAILEWNGIEKELSGGDPVAGSAEGALHRGAVLRLQVRY